MPVVLNPAAWPAWLGEEPTDAPQLKAGESLGLAASDDEKALGLQTRRTVQQCAFEIPAGDFSIGDQLGGDLLNGGIGGLDVGFGLIFAATVESDHDQAFGIQLGRSRGRQFGFHESFHFLQRRQNPQGAESWGNRVCELDQHTWKGPLGDRGPCARLRKPRRWYPQRSS